MKAKHVIERERRERQQRNPIWSIEHALQHGYVMQPHIGSGDFSGPNRMTQPHECAVRYHSLLRRKDGTPLADACEVQCAECAHICFTNDYVRGKLPPRYPVPAIRHDVVYWDCGGISISVPGECEYRYAYGRAFGHGVRINHWEP